MTTRSSRSPGSVARRVALDAGTDTVGIGDEPDRALERQPSAAVDL